MKNLDLLPLSAESKKRIDEFAKQYQRYGHISIEVVSYSDGRLIVRTEQKDLVNDKFLTKKELTERVREMFKGEIPDEWKLTVSAVNFDRKDIDSITVDWIKKRMEKLGLKSKHLSNYTGIDKCTVSSLLSGDKELTKWHKVALYFFKYYEVANF
jgi:antitoxin component HigA of HigAB toxin-antitoxin module